MAARRTILVTGATGRQGGAVARRLIEKREQVRVMTRTPERVRDLRRMGAEVVRADFDDYRTLEKAVKGVRGAFVMSTSYQKGPGSEAEQGRAMVHACLDEGVPHVVYSSVCCADRGTGIPHFESKHDIEEYLRESGLKRTILRPVSFMENFVSPRMRAALEEGSMSLPLDPETRLQMVCVDDIGGFACEAFLRPDEFVGAEIDLAGDHRTVRETVLELSCTMNRQVRYERIPDDRAEDLLGYDLSAMYAWMNEEGFDVDIEALKKRYGIPLTSFSRFLGRSGLYRKAA
jgi:uncharacterized protein YbjT (DUF2867 family)